MRNSTLKRAKDISDTDTGNRGGDILRMKTSNHPLFELNSKIIEIKISIILILESLIYIIPLVVVLTSTKKFANLLLV